MMLAIPAILLKERKAALLAAQDRENMLSIVLLTVNKYNFILKQ